jgi:hypothetical protein
MVTKKSTSKKPRTNAGEPTVLKLNKTRFDKIYSPTPGMLSERCRTHATPGAYFL